MQLKPHEAERPTRPEGLLAWAENALSWLLLAGWFGSWTLFAFVIAPTAFQVLPSQQEAGALVAPVLGVLHNYGIGAGLVLGLLAAGRRRGWVAVATPILLATLCAISQYGVTPAIEEASVRSFGTAQEPEAANRFSHLHQLSRTLFGIVEIGVLGTILYRARGRAPAQQDRF